jgi:hypothetical protein
MAVPRMVLRILSLNAAVNIVLTSPNSGLLRRPAAAARRTTDEPEP